MMARSCRLARQAFAKEFLQDFGYRDVRANVTVVHLALETALGEGLDVNPQAVRNVAEPELPQVAQQVAWAVWSAPT